MREKNLEELNIVMLVGGNLAALLCNILPGMDGDITQYCVFVIFWFAIGWAAWEVMGLYERFRK